MHGAGYKGKRGGGSSWESSLSAPIAKNLSTRSRVTRRCVRPPSAGSTSTARPNSPEENRRPHGPRLSDVARPDARSPSEIQAVDFDLVDQGRARNPQLQRGPGAVPAVVSQGTLDVLPLHLRQRLPRVAPLNGGALPQVGRQVLEADRRFSPPQDHRSLEHVAHLAHVAVPRRR